MRTNNFIFRQYSQASLLEYMLAMRIATEEKCKNRLAKSILITIACLSCIVEPVLRGAIVLRAQTFASEIGAPSPPSSTNGPLHRPTHRLRNIGISFAMRKTQLA